MIITDLILCINESFDAQEDIGVPFDRNFNSIFRRDHQKIPVNRAPMSR